MLRRLEAEEDAAEAGAEVAEDSVEGEEVEASEGAGEDSDWPSLL